MEVLGFVFRCGVVLGKVVEIGRVEAGWFEQSNAKALCSAVATASVAL
jgi:hypothetical protein